MSQFSSFSVFEYGVTVIILQICLPGNRENVIDVVGFEIQISGCFFPSVISNLFSEH